MPSRPRANSPRRAGFFALPAIGALVLTTALSSCTTNACEGDDQTYGSLPGQGDWIDEDTWESSPLNGPWIPFTPERRYHFVIPGFNGRVPEPVALYESVSCLPNSNNVNSDDCTLEPDADSTVEAPSQSFTPPAGNLAEWEQARPNQIDLLNDTCGSYYVRVILHAYPVRNDAGAPPDAGSADATVDGSAIQSDGAAD